MSAISWMRIHVAGRAVAVHRHDRVVRGVMAASICAGSRLHVSGSMSTNTGVMAVPQQRMRGRDEGERGGDDLAGHAQRLQRRHQCDRAVGEQREVIDTEVARQRRLELLVERPAVVSHLLSQICSRYGRNSSSGGMNGCVT